MATKKKRKTAKKRGGRFNPFSILNRMITWVFRFFVRLMLRGALAAFLVLAVAVWYTYTTLPPVETLLDGRARGSVTLLDRDGEVYAWRGQQFGGRITADTVSPYLKNAIIATEDKRFYWHPGIDPRGIASAIKINLREGRGPLSGHGGSTITQQTAKLLCLGVPFDPDTWVSEADYESDCRTGSLWRKGKEAVYAMAMEVKYTKNEILTIYINRAFLGAGSRGFEAAARRYFDRSAAQVDPAQAAMLAGLLVAPTRFAPTNNLERSQDRALVILGLMEDQGYLSAQEAAIARANPATLSPAAAARAGGYFADWVMKAGPSFLTNDTTEDVILRTTFDPRIQKSAEDAVQFIFDTKVREGSKAQAAVVVMSADGAVRAMVGGRKFKGVAGQFNRAVMAKRQTGSAFKPFVYAAAMELGYSPLDTVIDNDVTFRVPGSGAWRPQNYDERYRGSVTLSRALAQSINIPAVKVSEAVGRDNVRKVAEDFGIISDLAAGPALALGVSEASLLEMTGAYAGILNGGSSVDPYGIIELRLKGDSAPLIGQSGGLGERVISTQAARSLIYMMHQVVETGTGKRAQLPDRQSAGKTGTTQGQRDAWFIGFTADYVAGVWMGYDDNTPLMDVTGGSLPADIWRETMVRVNRGLPVRGLPMDIPRRRTTPPAQPQPPAQPPTANANNTQAEKILLDVLDGLLGR